MSDISDREGILLIVSSTRMSLKSVDHAIRSASSTGKPLHVAFILDSELPDSIFEQLTVEGYLGDRPGEIIHDAVLQEYEYRGKKIIKEICKRAKEKGVECQIVFEKGNFLDNCRRIIASEKIKHVVITRRRRSNLSRFIFGSAIDQLMCENKDVVFDVFAEED